MGSVMERRTVTVLNETIRAFKDLYAKIYSRIQATLRILNWRLYVTPRAGYTMRPMVVGDPQPFLSFSWQNACALRRCNGKKIDTMCALFK